MSEYSILKSQEQIHYTSLSKKERKIDHEFNPIKQLKAKHRAQNKDFRMIIAGDNGNGKSALAAREGVSCM